MKTKVVQVHRRWRQMGTWVAFGNIFNWRICVRVAKIRRVLESLLPNPFPSRPRTTSKSCPLSSTRAASNSSPNITTSHRQNTSAFRTKSWLMAAIRDGIRMRYGSMARIPFLTWSFRVFFPFWNRIGKLGKENCPRPFSPYMATSSGKNLTTTKCVGWRSLKTPSTR